MFNVVLVEAKSKSGNVYNYLSITIDVNGKTIELGRLFLDSKAQALIDLAK